MKPEKYAQLKKIVLRATELPAEEQKVFLDEACGDDPELRREAESILAHRARPSEILQKAGMVPEMADEPEEEAPAIPVNIAEYRIIRKLGEGGMGVVYEALQEKPERTVALKVMKAGVASASALRRFEYESQLLARLQHPGIAQVYEAGTYDDGTGAVPYFAMEYVPEARSVIEYAGEKKLGTRERLQLFAQVCDAVHHGHQKGIIHRDLKPGNILVNPEGQVKIIDFGVARSTDSDLALTTLQTNVGQLIGTLQYMSPEQCEADPQDIDTRSDVYALGVVQYELLCDRLPYDVRKKALHEVTRVIREEQPTRPSTISRQLRGDVETIALKALEKERDRRYQSAVELAQDIRRYLAGEAIVGRPPSIVYQFRIFARRHRALFAALMAVFVVLAGGLVFSTFMYLRAELARAESEAVTGFLSETLAAVDPWEGQGREVTVLEMLKKAEEKIEEAFPGQPLAEAALRATIGNSYVALGEYPTAEPHLETALAIRRERLGEEHPDTLTSMHDLAGLYCNQGRDDEAEPLNLRTLELRRRLLGEEHPDTLDTLNTLGWIYYGLGRLEDAEAVFTDALELRRRVLGEEHLHTLASMDNLANMYKFQCRYDEAQPLSERVLECYRRILGEEHPRTVGAMFSLGHLYSYQFRYDKAEPLVMRSLELYRRLLGEDHPQTAAATCSVGVWYWTQDRYDEAEPYVRKAVEIAERVLGAENPSTLDYRSCLAFTWSHQGRYAQAETLFKRVLEVTRRVEGEEGFGTLDIMLKLGWMFIEQGRYGEAEEMFLKIVSPDFPGTDKALFGYGVCLLKTKRFSEAEVALLEVHEAYTAENSIPAEKTKVEILETLAALYDTWGKPDQADQWRAKLPEPEGNTAPQPAG